MARGARRAQDTPAKITLPRILLLLSTLALLLVGFVMVYSSSTVEALSNDVSTTSYLTDQLSFAALGIVAAAVVYRFIPCRTWRGRLVWVVWGVAVAALVATALFGIEENGATRWLAIGPASIQPSEFAKIALVLMAARILAELREGTITVTQAFFQFAALILCPVLLIFFAQSDLGTTVIIVVGMLALLWVGEMPFKGIAVAIALVLVFVVVAIFLGGYRSDRFVYLDPWNDGAGGEGTGWQIIHSYYAFAEGGLFGVGIGNSREKYLYLPEAETDFIFAIVGEELGLVGALLVIALFLLFLYAGMRIAYEAADLFGSMIAGSLAMMIVFQAFLNIGGVIGVFPMTGKPLPFLSSGGSSLVATLIMVGLILSVSREAAMPTVYERRRDDLRIVRVTDGADARGAQGARARQTAARGAAGSARR